jgi:hypothetical protein
VTLGCSLAAGGLVIFSIARFDVDGICELDIVDEAVKLASEFDSCRVELSWHWGACNSGFGGRRGSCRRCLWRPLTNGTMVYWIQ